MMRIASFAATAPRGCSGLVPDLWTRSLPMWLRGSMQPGEELGSHEHLCELGVSPPPLIAGEPAAVRRPHLQRHHQVGGELPDRHV